jgi:cardiolipin synthase
MNDESQVIAALWAGAFLLVHLGVIARVILRPHREPASRVAWIVVMIVLPVIGILTYILLGETSIGRRRVSRLHVVLAAMPDLTKAPGMDSPNLQPKIPETACSHPVTAETVAQWPMTRRLWNNTIAMLGPIL